MIDILKEHKAYDLGNVSLPYLLDVGLSGQETLPRITMKRSVLVRTSMLTPTDAHGKV